MLNAPSRSHGTNRLIESEAAAGAVEAIAAGTADLASGAGPPLWDGRASDRIAEVVVGWVALGR